MMFMALTRSPWKPVFQKPCSSKTKIFRDLGFAYIWKLGHKILDTFVRQTLAQSNKSAVRDPLIDRNYTWVRLMTNYTEW